MARETTMTQEDGSINGMIEGIGGLGTDVITLATLQARLAAKDLQEMTDRAIPAVVLVALLVPLAFAGFTAILFGLAYWINTAFNVPMPASLAAMGVVGLVLAGILAFFARNRFSASLVTFRRSREELERNLAWLGTVLKQSGR
jgi:hypothetical protein